MIANPNTFANFRRGEPSRGLRGKASASVSGFALYRRNEPQASVVLRAPSVVIWIQDVS